MCGLIGWFSHDDSSVAPDLVLDQYERQHSRGKNGFGLIRVSKDTVEVKRATEPVKALLDVALSKTPTLMFHHRMPTSTDNEMEQTHPLVVSHKELKFDYLVMHNGVIRNSRELRPKHEELGYIYHTLTESAYKYSGYAGSYEKFNDSESLAIELARFIEDRTDGVSAFGSNAFMALALDKKTRKPVTIYFGTNGGNELSFMDAMGLLIGSELPEDRSTPCMPNMYYELSCKALFGKQTGKSVLQMCRTFPLVYLEEPVMKIEPAKKTETTVDKVFGTSSSSLRNTNPRDGEPIEATLYPNPDDDAPEDPRSIATSKRLDRFLTNDLLPLLEAFFYDASYDEQTDDDVDGLLMTMRNELMNQLPMMNKIREYHDNIEDSYFAMNAEDQEEINRLRQYSDDDAPNYDEDNIPVKNRAWLLD